MLSGLGWLLPCGGKGQFYALSRLVLASATGGWRGGQHILLSGWVGFCHVDGRVSFMRPVGLDSATWREGSAVALNLDLASAAWREGLGLASATGPGTWVIVFMLSGWVCICVMA